MRLYFYLPLHIIVNREKDQQWRLVTPRERANYLIHTRWVCVKVPPTAVQVAPHIYSYSLSILRSERFIINNHRVI